MNKLLPAIACLALAPLAHAQEERGMYIGGGLGTFDYSEPDDSFFPVSDTTWTYSLFGGYQFNRYFALEVGIAGTGSDLEENFPDVAVPPFGIATLEVNEAFDIYTLQAVGFLPISKFNLFAGVGYFSASVNGSIDLSNASGSGTVAAGSDHTNGTAAMFGIQKNFGLDLKNFSVRGYYQWYDFDADVDGSGIVIGATYRF
jgi:OOP family OmpA-OmpF porin